MAECCGDTCMLHVQPCDSCSHEHERSKQSFFCILISNHPSFDLVCHALCVCVCVCVRDCSKIDHIMAHSMHFETVGVFISLPDVC